MHDISHAVAVRDVVHTSPLLPRPPWNPGAWVQRLAALILLGRPPATWVASRLTPPQERTLPPHRPAEHLLCLLGPLEEHNVELRFMQLWNQQKKTTQYLIIRRHH